MSQVNSVPPDAALASSAAPESGGAQPLSREGALQRALRRLVGTDAFASARSVYRLSQTSDRKAPFPLTYKLGAWRHGFYADSMALYDFPRNDWREYVSDYTVRFRCGKINPEPQFFHQKLMLRTLLLHKAFAQAETVAVVAAGRIQLKPFDDDARYVSPAEFERWLIDDGGRFIVKPNDGRYGVGVYQLEARGGTIVRRRGTETFPLGIEQWPRVTLVERRIEQGAFWRNLYPESTNSIRAVTMWTPGDPAPFLAAASQRIGTANTMPTDNFTAGGISARIDLTTGRLGLGRNNPVKGKRERATFTHQPDTGAQIEGAMMPHWDAVRDVVVRAAATLPTNPYVGWDVAVDDRGVPVIIEGNHNGHLDVIQVHGGILKDPAVRRFYERVAVI
jgi:hypothetical protein